MKLTFLDFEQPIAELEAKIEELSEVQGDPALDISEEIERLRITDDEKKAIESALGWCDDRDTKTISTLNGLLKRLK